MANYAYNSKTWYYERTDWGSDTYKSKWWWTTTVWWGKVTTTPARSWWSSSSSSSGWWSSSSSFWWSSSSSSWWSSWWSSSSRSWSSWTYRWAWGSWLTNTDYASKYANNSTYQSLVSQYWANNVHDALDYITTSGWWNKTQIQYLLSWWGSTDLKSNPTINYNTNGSQLRSWWWGSSSTAPSEKWDDNMDQKYTVASIANYNNAYNHLKGQGMSDADAKNAASWLLEKQDLLKWKTEEQIATETQKTNEDEDFDYLNDIMNGLEENPEEEDYTKSQERQDLMWYIDDLEWQVDSLTSSNVIKTSVPEERDTSYDYNTYYKENLAPDNNYENWESKNTLNEEPQVTLVSQYQEPVSTALNDLGLLTPNEAVANETPNTEEPDLPKGYENWEDIVTDFENQLQTLWSEEGTGLTPQAVAQTYSDFKNQLVQYANNNNLSKEEYEELLSQLKNNEILQNVLVNKQ